MYNLFFKILILVIFISTLGILGLKPKMHSKMLIYDSSYKIVENIPETSSQTTIPQKEETYSLQTTVSNIPAKTTEKKDKKVNKVSAQKQIQTPKKETKEKIVQNKIVQEPVKISAKTVSPKKQEVIKETPQKTETITQQEEEIAWNIWRSNLQNQIMRDVKLPYVPKGTVFKFSFDVDKYGRISNIHTQSLNPNYTPYAIQYIAPVIRSYQGKDILDFPQRTQRTSTKFEGGWKISDSSKFSTPNDYNDIEKVKK